MGGAYDPTRWSRRPSLSSLAVPDEYFIRDGYRARVDPQYDLETELDGVVWQPDVYPDAARIAGLVGASCIIDVGTGDGSKLAALHPRFDVIGMDLPGPNLDYCRDSFPRLNWIEHDVESLQPLPVPDVLLSRSVVVCADVIEHLRRPERLLRKLRAALYVCPAVVISTPERELTRGVDHAGPPPNPSHVREWSSAELSALLDHLGFGARSMSLTRSNDRINEDKTILCELFREEGLLAMASAA